MIILGDKKIEEIIADVRAMLGMENLYLTDDELEVLRKYGKGKLTQEEVFEIFKI